MEILSYKPINLLLYIIGYARGKKNTDKVFLVILESPNFIIIIIQLYSITLQSCYE